MIQLLMQQSVDYAGLYPPAGLSLPEVVQNYANYVGSPDAWMLSRLIVPLKQLSQVVDLIQAQPAWGRPWKLSCLVVGPEIGPGGFGQAWSQIAKFNSEHGDCAIVDSVETKADRPKAIQDFAGECLKGISVYWELPHQIPVDEFLGPLAVAGQRAKIRTGGVQANQIAEIADVARFVEACARSKLAFKATAGLHHPIRSEYPLTYEPNSPCAIMHGFLNLFFASVAAWSGKLNSLQLEAILKEQDATQFRFESNSIRWQDIVVSQSEVCDARKSFLISFGSCSFTEPLGDLRDLGLLTPS